jgi:hypothetical protein
MVNKSTSYAVYDVELSVTSSMMKKTHNRMLIKKTIPKIDKGGSFSQIIEIKAD